MAQGRKKVVTTLYLTKEQAKWSKAEAKRRDTSQANVLREAIEAARNNVFLIFEEANGNKKTMRVRSHNDRARIGPAASPVRA